MKWQLPEADKYFAPALAKDERGFEIAHLEAALKFCKNWRTAIDGGAHIGTWAFYMAQRLKRVLAFEPAMDTFACLRHNLASVSNAELFNMGLGAVHARAKVIEDSRRIGNTGARHLVVNGTGDVEVVPIDRFGVLDLDFLKLDVEGYELYALKGAVETIRACKPVIVIEVKRFVPQRFGVSEIAASEFLIGELGYKQIFAMKNDRVFVHAGDKKKHLVGV